MNDENDLIESAMVKNMETDCLFNSDLRRDAQLILSFKKAELVFLEASSALMANHWRKSKARCDHNHNREMRSEGSTCPTKKQHNTSRATHQKESPLAA